MTGPKARVLPFLVVTFLLLPACAERASPSLGRASVAALSGAQALGASPATGISVQGEGVVSVKPDTAEVGLGVEVKHRDLAQALKEANLRMNAVTDKLVAIGISKDIIKTSGFNISPEYSGPTLTGFRAYNVVSFKVKETSRVGEIVDEAIAAGANRVDWIRFTIEDPKPHASRAREEAMADARARAEQLARLSGVRLGRPIAINESGGRLPPFYGGFAFAAPAAALAERTPILPGEVEIRVNVQVTYAIE